MLYTVRVKRMEESYMNQSQQTPPQFEPKKTKSGKWMALGCSVIVLSGLFGFTGSYVANHINGDKTGVTIQQIKGKPSHQSNIKDVSDIAEKCGPSVVEIRTESVSNGNDFFGQYVQQGAGSGVIIDKDGFIVTNNHVINGANSIVVRTMDGQEYEAQLVGADAQTDLAVLKVDATGLNPATFGDSDSLEVGNAAIVIGNPLGELGGSVSSGIISALDRQIEVEGETMTLLQTDAAVNPGNSGGGMFDANGNLIGIVNAKKSSSGIEGLGFAIPINGAIDIIDELIENGEVTNRPALNVSLQEIHNKQNIPGSKYQDGCYIVQIIKDGAADKAGLRPYDRIVRFDGQDIKTASDVKTVLHSHKIGDKVKMTVDRDGKQIDVEITLQPVSN